VNVPCLHRRRVRFLERNTLFHALLGAISFGNRFDLAVAQLTSDIETRTNKGSREQPSQSVYVVLGALSLWRHIKAELTGWGAIDAHASSAADERTRMFLAPRSLLK